MSRSPPRAASMSAVPDADVLIDGFVLDRLQPHGASSSSPRRARATRRRSRPSLGIEASYHGFVGSRRKMAALRATLAREGVAAGALYHVKAPAGLDIGAITPEEIALSILAEIIVARRAGQREASPKPEAAKA